ncbi:MAG TPA: ATP-binding protein [Ktedonobacteraceae bacterium]|nr:ATP-binding protein [Ktedonobacteraceae bacterium]
MSFLLALFEPAYQTPSIHKNLRQQTQRAYLKNPLPVRLKEKLFAYLARYCNVPYLLICHACLLYSQGMTAQEIQEFLSTPPLDEKSLPYSLELLKRSRIHDIAQLSPELEHVLFQVLVYLYRHINQSNTLITELQEILSAAYYNHILLFFGYIQTSLLWSETHPTILHPTDKPTLKQLEALLQQGPDLAIFFHSYQIQAQAETEPTKLDSIDPQRTTIHDEFSTMFELMADGIIFYDAQGNITRINQAACEIFGYRQDEKEFIQADVVYRLKKSKPANELGERIMYDQTALAHILKGEILKGPNALDYIIQGPDGQKKIVSTTGAPIYQADGKIIGAFCQVRDVTERRQLEQQTRKALSALIEMAELLIQLPSDKENEPTPEEKEILAVPQTIHIISERIAELVQQVLNCSRISILLIDEQTQLLIPVAQRGSSPTQVIYWWKRIKTMTITELLGDQAVEKLKRHETVYPSRDELPDPSRFKRYNIHNLLVAPILQNEQLYGIMMMDTDLDDHKPSGRRFTDQEIAITQAITQLVAIVIERDLLIQERAEAQANEMALRQTNRQLDEFISIISHELRTPLTTITICLQLAMRKLKKLMQEQISTAEEIQPDLEKIEESLLRADSHIVFQNRLIGDLLDVSRIQSHKLEMLMEPCDLRLLVHEIFKEQQIAHPERSIQIFLPLEPFLMVQGDATRLEQVIMNYLSNALKYSPQGTPIQGRLQIHQTYVCFSLQDQGPGLASDVQQHIWERFYQVSGVKADSQSSGGMGLGLHICRSIIERHGGRVGIKSEVGQGSTFWFTIPLLSTTTVEPQISPVESSSQEGLTN